MSEMEEERPLFIPFAKSQQRLLQEINRRQMREMNTVLDEIYDEIPEIDGEAKNIVYTLRRDMSGVDVKYLPDLKGENKTHE